MELLKRIKVRWLRWKLNAAARMHYDTSKSYGRMQWHSLAREHEEWAYKLKREAEKL